MSFSLITSGSGVTNTTTATTSALNTTGADFLVATLSFYFHALGQTFSDNKGNTWTGLTLRTNGNGRCMIYYCKSPTVGTGHTFTLSSGGGAIYPVVNVLAFSGGHLTSPFDAENGAAGSGTSLSTGSVTPSEGNELVIAGLMRGSGSSNSINGGFSISSQVAYAVGNNMGGAAAYLIQTSAAAVNPQWSWSTSDSLPCAAIACFKSAAGGGGTILPFVNNYMCG